MRITIGAVALIVIGLALFVWLRPGQRVEPIASLEAPTVTAMPETLAAPEPVLERAQPRAIAERAPENSAESLASSATGAEPRCLVFGRVVDERGAPLSSVDLSLYPVGGRWSETSDLPLAGPEERRYERMNTTTSADGSFRFEAPPPTADWITLTVSPPHYFALYDRMFGPAGGRNQPRLTPGGNDLGNIVLPACGAVSGRVVSDAGIAIASAGVSIAGVNSQGRVTNATSDAQGRFLLGHVPEGKFAMSVTAEGWVSARDVAVEVRREATSQVPDIVLSRAAEIGGVVVDETGAPVAGVRLRGRPQGSGQSAGTRTKEDGTFTMSLPQTEPYTLEVQRADEYEPWGGRRGAQDATFEPGRMDIRIVLKRAARTTFRVIDAAARRPIERFGIRIEEKLPPGSHSSGSEREIDLADYPRGEVVLPTSLGLQTAIVRAPGYAPLAADVTHDAGEPGVQTLMLATESALEGRVLLAGAPLARASVRIERESLDPDGRATKMEATSGTNVHHDVGSFAGRRRTATTDSAGTFRFDELAAGTYRLRFEGPGAGRAVRRAVVVPASQTLRFDDVDLAASASVRGRLVTAAGESPIGFKVRVGHDFTRQVEISKQDGSFEFTGLEAGAHTIAWERPGRIGKSSMGDEGHELSIELAAGESRDIVLNAAESAPCAVVVRVERGGAPVAGIRVQAEIALESSNGRRFVELGESGADGVVNGEVEGGRRFDLVALSRDDLEIGDGGRGIEATAGARLERTIELSTGSLTIEMPDGFAAPDRGLLSIAFRTTDRPWWRGISARTAGAPIDRGEARAWDGGSLEIEELRAGEYSVGVTISRYEPDAERPGSWRTVAIRDPHSTTITIEAGRTTKLAVP